MKQSSQVLLKTVSAGRPRQVRLLLDSGANTEEEDECGQTPLIRAVFLGHDKNRERILKLLLKCGAIVSHADVVGRNALSWACLYGRDAEVPVLLAHADVDLDINQCDVNGQTALFHAATSGNAATVKLLIDALMKYNLSVEIKNFNGITPLMQAMRLGNDICANILIHQGHATAGLGGQFAENYIRQDKWAIRSSRDKERLNPMKLQFPPILPNATINKIQYRENKANRLRVVTPASAESESESMMSSQSSSNLDDVSDNVFVDTSMRVSRSRQRNVTQTISPASSTVCNVSSDDDVDLYSTPCYLGTDLKPSHDLHMLFDMYQKQASKSYRSTVVPPPLGLQGNLNSGSSESTDSSERKGMYNITYGTAILK